MIVLGPMRVWLLEPPTLETVDLEGELLNEWLDHKPVELHVVRAEIALGERKETP